VDKIQIRLIPSIISIHLTDIYSETFYRHLQRFDHGDILQWFECAVIITLYDSVVFGITYISGKPFIVDIRKTI
jgi:hypothetical protein